MADPKRINALTNDNAPLATDVVPIDSTTGGTTRSSSLQNIVDAVRPLADEDAAKGQSDDVGAMTSAKVFASIKQLVEYINPRETRFAGGMPANGIDDDAPAMRAALAYAKSVGGSTYVGGTVKIVIPHGALKFLTPDPAKSDRIINTTGANNITIEGQGPSATTGMWESNRALFRSDYVGDPSGTLSIGPDPLSFCTIEGMRLYGPGRAQTNADAFDFGPSNNTRVKNMIIYAARRAVAYQDVFHCNLKDVYANGTGGLACFDGIYAKDGTINLAENAMRIEGCRIWGAERWGFRGENVSGTDVYATEILGCGSAGVYLGESPSGKDLKWFSWFGGLIDSCSDLVVVKAGSSAVAELVHFTGVWDSYAFEPLPGAGIGVEFVGMKDSSFTCAVLANTVYAANVQNCERVTLRADTLHSYDRNNQGAIAVLLQNSTGCTVDIGTSRKNPGSLSTIAVKEFGSCDRNLVRGNLDGDVVLVGANSRFEGIKIP